jgi:type IV secretory pathway VirB10-like protein
MDIEIANVDKLKVAELRALLSSHELDTKGTKPILVARLTSYLESLPPKDPNAPVVEAAPVAATEEPMEEEEAAPAKAETPAKAPVASPKKEVASPKKEVASPKKRSYQRGRNTKG